MELLLAVALGACVTYIVLNKKMAKVTSKELDKETIERNKKFTQHFEGLMSYDAKQAYKGGKK